jgi:hypothetical protein
MTRQSKARIVRLSLCLCALLYGCLGAPSVNLSGTWTGSMTYTTGPAAGFAFPLTLQLTQDPGGIEGTITLRSHADHTYDLSIAHSRSRAQTVLLVARGNNPWVPGEPAIELTLDAEHDRGHLVGVGTQRIDQAIYAFTWEATRSGETEGAAKRPDQR